MGTASVVTLAGDMDLADTDRVRGQLREAIDSAAPPPLVIVDLTGVTFMDSTGLSAMISARRAMADRGGSLRLVINTRRILTLFRLTSLHKTFEIFECMQDAVDHVARVTGPAEA